MRFRLLGPVQIKVAGQWSLIGASQQRVVLAALLAETPGSISAHRLIEEIWGEDPPRAALGTLQGYVFRLRRMLGDQMDGLLTTTDQGYQLTVAEDDVDARVFERLVASGRQLIADNDLPAAERQLGEALALWRGAALADVAAGPIVTAEAGRLDLARLDAAEDRLGVLLDLGRAGEVVTETTRLVQQYPLRERLWEHHLGALIQCGRRSDALAAYQQARRMIVAELGLEPGTRLKELHLQALAGQRSSASASPAKTVTPAQLPAEVAGFTGRAAELKQLNAHLSGNGSGSAVVICTVDGAGGVGKTALGLRWAHQAKHRYPDGQLFVNLQGHALTAPVRPIAALAGMLRALGTPPSSIPDSVGEAAGLYRSVLAGKRVLVFLDNALDAAQVRPLLPADSGCHVLVTSRDKLVGLVAHDGAKAMTLNVLDPVEARHMMTHLLSAEPTQTETAALAELAELCGYLPLAMRIAAAHLSTDPGLTIPGYLDRLRVDRLGALRVPGDQQANVRATFHLSYVALEREAQRVFRLFGVLPGQDVTAHGMASLAGKAVAHTGSLLDRLVEVRLIDRSRTGRYSMHDLLRQYAGEQASTLDSRADRQAALRQLLDYYLRHVEGAAARLYPEFLRIPGFQAQTRHEFDDDAQATAWLEGERHNLVAAVQTATDTALSCAAWRLADALRGYLYPRMYTVDWQAVAAAGLSAAQADGQPVAQAAMHLSLGMLHAVQGRAEPAIDHFTGALVLARQHRWAQGEADALGSLGTMYANTGALDRAAGYYTQALRIDRQSGYTAGHALRLTNLGLTNIDRGRLRMAAGQLAQAVELNRRSGNQMAQARTLASLGDAYHAMGRFAMAQDALTEALTLHRQLGDRATEADTIWALAAVYRDTGRYDQALDLAGTAVTQAEKLGRRRVHANALVVLGTTQHRLGHHDRALASLRHAVELAHDLDEPLIESGALIGLADVHRALGDLDEALRSARSALDCARDSGYLLLHGQALTASAAIQLDGGQNELAAALAEQAIVVNRATGHLLGLARAHLVAAGAYAIVGHHGQAASHRAKASSLLQQIGVSTERFASHHHGRPTIP